MAQQGGGVAPFDFAAAKRLREERERALELLRAEEARNAAAAEAAAADDPTLGGSAGWMKGGGAAMQQQAPPHVTGGRSPLERQQLIYDGIVHALVSAGVTLLRPPVVEAAEGSLAYTVRGREGLDLYELKMSSQRQFVLVRAAKSTGAFGPTGLVAGHGPAAAADVSIPMIGQTLTLMLDLSRYVVERESGALVLVNEALLLSNLNENVLSKYGLHASTVRRGDGGGSGSGRGRGLAGARDFARRHAVALLVVATAAAAAAVAATVASVRARRK